MRTRHQAAEHDAHVDPTEQTPSSSRKTPNEVSAKAVVNKASKRTEPRTVTATRKVAAVTKTHSSGAAGEQGPLLDGAGSAAPGTRGASKQAKTAKGKAGSAKSRTGSQEEENKEQQDEVQVKKRRKGGAPVASKSAEPDVAEGVAAVATGASVDAEALESNAALQVPSEETDRQVPAPELGAGAERAPHVEAGEEDEEDEAPEEVSMAAGRAGAAAARREEREMAAQKKRLAKEKGRKRAALAEADRDARLAAQQPGSGTQVLNQEEAEEEEEDDDLLPAAVIEAVKRSREARAAEVEADGAAQQPAAARKPAKRGDPSQPKKLGPFLVQPLSSLPDKKASESAQQFSRQRLFGRGVKRSAEMLIPSTARYYGPAVNF